MKLYRYNVAGIATANQSDAGKLRDFFACQAYSDTQALAWAAQRAGSFLTDLRITSKTEV